MSAAPALPSVRVRRRAASLPPDARRTAIVEATIPLLLEHGESVTTRQIADAAGIAEGTIFRVFSDKDALLDAAIDAVLDPAPLERALGQVDPSLPLAELVVKAVEISQRRLAEVWRLLSTVGGRAHERKPRPIAESPALVGLFEAHRPDLAVTPRLAARNLRALTLAMSHPLMVDRPASPREITRFFLHGVQAGGQPC